MKYKMLVKIYIFYALTHTQQTRREGGLQTGGESDERSLQYFRPALSLLFPFPSVIFEKLIYGQQCGQPGGEGSIQQSEGGEGSGGQLGGQIEFGQQNSPKAAAKTYQVSDFVVVYVAAAAAALRPFCTVLLPLSLCFSLPRFFCLFPRSIHSQSY